MKSIFASIAAISLAFVQLPANAIERETRDVTGWTVHIDKRLLAGDEAKTTERALELLKKQLDQIVIVVPSNAVNELRKVPLYFSPPYSNAEHRAEFHPSEDWLSENGRDPVMAEAIEFSDTREFESSMARMPNFVLHELAHAYHYHTVPDGWDNQEIEEAYEKAWRSGKYDKVERVDGEGHTISNVLAYAMTDSKEYFAESTEAYFVRNDFFPYTREEFKKHDPEFYAMIEKFWGVKPAKP